MYKKKKLKGRLIRHHVELSLENHVRKIVREGNYISVIVKIAFKNVDNEIFKETWSMYVGPTLKYVSAALSPH